MIIITLIGCSYLEQVNCSADEVNYINSSINWINNNSNNIQLEANKLWNNKETEITNLTKELNEVEVGCGIQVRDNDLNVGGELINNNLILINANEDFNNYVNLYLNSRWVEGYSRTEIIDRALSINNTDDVNDYAFYLASIGKLSDTLLHETAHIILGSHNKKLTSNNFQPILGQPIDEIYAWGDAALLAAQAEQKITYHNYIYNYNE